MGEHKLDHTNRPSLSKALGNRIKEWMLETDVHGLPNIARHENRLIQVIWAICFCLSTATCSFLVVRSINSYFDHEVFSKYDLIFEAPAVFPTVTICDLNPFVTAQATDYVKSIMDRYNITFESFVNESNTNYKLPGTQLKQMLSNAKYLAILNTETMNQTAIFRKSLGLKMNNFFISCEFESIKCSFEDDFDWHFDFVYGNCYSYGKKTPKITNKAGNLDGLVVHLAVGLGDPEENYTLSIKSGAHIFIHNQTIMPTSYEGYDVAPGTSTSFIVNRQWNNKLPKPFNECYDDLTSMDSYDSVLYREIIKANLTYRQIDCFRLCYQKQTVEKCKCNDPTIPSIFVARICLSTWELECLLDVYTRFKIDDNCLNMW